MRPSFRQSACVAAFGLIVLMLTGGTPALAAAGAPGLLSQRYPLGTETVCCQASSSVTRASSPPTTPNPTATPNPTPRTRIPTHHDGVPRWALFALAGAVLALVVLEWFVVRARRRAPQRPPRARREISPALLAFLAPMFRRDGRRDAWVLRGVGHRFGPVLRRRSRALARRPYKAARRSRDPADPESQWPAPYDDSGADDGDVPPLSIRPRRK